MNIISFLFNSSYSSVLIIVGLLSVFISGSHFGPCSVGNLAYYGDYRNRYVIRRTIIILIIIKTTIKLKGRLIRKRGVMLRIGTDGYR